MSHMLMLCAIGPAGDAFWEQSARLFVEERDRNVQAGLYARIESRDLFPEGADDRLPPCHEIARLLQERIPARKIDSLQLGVALAVVEPRAVERLDTFLEAIENISQMPAQAHVFVLGPDAYVRFSPDLSALERTLSASTRHNLHCRDVCWVRVGREPKTREPSPLADSQVRAATHPLWTDAHEAQRPFSILLGLDSPFRDSVACRLIFDRRRWERYASAHVATRLAAAVATEPRPGLSQRVEDWLRNSALSPLCASGIVDSGKLNPSITCPGDTLDTAPEELLTQAVNAQRDLVARVRGLEFESLDRQILALEKERLPEAMKEATAGASDEVQELAMSGQWAAALRSAVKHAEHDMLSQASLPLWMDACNALLPPVFGLDAEREGFDIGSPASWPDRLAELRTTLARVLVEPEERRRPLRYCAAAWIDRLLPDILRAPDACNDTSGKVMEPVEQAMASCIKRILDAQHKHRSEKAAIEARFPRQTGFLSRIEYRLVEKRRMKHALTECARKHEQAIHAAYSEADALLLASANWLAVAIHHDRRRRLAANLAASVDTVLQPVDALLAGFAAKAQTSRAEMAGMPAEPAGSEDTIVLPHCDQMVVLAARIDTDQMGWLVQARRQVPEETRTWQSVVGVCLATVDSWSLERARSMQIDLSGLLLTCFPELLDPTLARLKDLGHAALLPVRHERAAQRRLHQEWHLPPESPRWRESALDQFLVSDDTVSTTPTSCARFVSPDPDLLELHLHLLGFKPEDYQHWKLFHG